jgi:hypothetical protein
MTTGYEGWEVPKEKYTVIHPEPVTGSGIQDVVIAEDRFAILATQSGIDIVDLQCGAVISSALVSDTEVISLAVDDVTITGCLYIGTSTSGVLATRWGQIRAPGTDFTGKIEQVYTNTGAIALSDNRINDLDAKPYKLLISTGSGVDFISIPAEGKQYISTRTLFSGSNSCQMTSAGEAYWTVVNSGVEANYDLISTTGVGIINIDAEYNTTSHGPLLPHNIVNEVRVSPGTPNVLNVATASGDFMIEEERDVNLTGTQRNQRLTVGLNVVSTDFTQGTTYDDGGKYTTTTGIATIFGLSSSSGVTVSGTHHQEIAALDIFTRENTRDQAVITGTNTVIRTTSVA